MPNSVSSERQLLDSLLDTLRGLPVMHANLSEIVQSGDRSRRYDAQIDLRRGRKVTTLLINVKSPCILVTYGRYFGETRN